MTGDGLYDGLDWMAKSFKKNWYLFILKICYKIIYEIKSFKEAK